MTDDREFTGTEPPRWSLTEAWKIGLADVVFAVFAIAVLLTANQGMLDDPGLGWHLRNVDAMYQQGGWLTVDPFSLPQTARWYSNQWVGDVWLRLGEWWGGLNGIAVVTSLVLAFTFRTLFTMLRQDGIAWPAALFWTYLAAAGTSSSWVARPNIFTILFVFLVARIVQQFHAGKTGVRGLCWLVPVFVIWANTHGGFVAGLIILAVAGMVEITTALLGPDAAQRTAATRRAGALVLASAGAVAATMINPYGPALYPWIFCLLGDNFFMNLNTEWQSPDFHSPYAMRFELLILLLVMGLAFGNRRFNVMNLSLAAVWLHFALNGRRYVPLWVVIVVPLLAQLFRELPGLTRLFAKVRLSEELRDALTAAPRSPRCGGTVLMCLLLLVWCRFSPGNARHDPKNLPVIALQKLLDSYEGGPAFHDYNWGGYLTWHGWRDGFLNWIDDRNEVQGRSHIEEYFLIINAQPGWNEILAKHQFRWICVLPASPLARRLDETEQWQLVHRDPYAVLYRNTHLE